MDFTGKVIIITGASSGIGKETSIGFSKYHSKLCLVGRNLENLEKTAEMCRTGCLLEQDIIIIQADLTEKGSSQRIVNETVSKFGRLDILINNAGILLVGSLEETSMEDYDRVMNTNLRTMFELTKLCIPYLVESHGNVVNVSSVNGIRSFTGSIAYSISKSAVDQFTRCLSLELGPKNVRVNCINPGYVKTNITRYTGLNEEHLNKFIECTINAYPLRRIGEVNDISSVILFLASDLARNVTGVTMPCDGGRHSSCGL